MSGYLDFDIGHLFVIWPWSFVIFLFGLALGSFANVVIFRMDNLRSILAQPSHCPHCNHRLAWYDLIPLLSFVFLRGRCRYCGRPISWQYPAVELIMGILAVLLLAQFGMTVSFLLHLILATLLVVLAVYDFLHMLLPDSIIFPGIGLALVTHLASYGLSLSSIKDIALGIVVGAGFLAVLYFLGKGQWIGFGDVKLGFLMGVYLSWPLTLAALFVAFLSGAAISLLLILLQKKTMHSQVPFGPFLVLGTLVALFWGKELVIWYDRAFL